MFEKDESLPKRKSIDSIQIGWTIDIFLFFFFHLRYWNIIQECRGGKRGKKERGTSCARREIERGNILLKISMSHLASNKWEKLVAIQEINIKPYLDCLIINYNNH